MPGLKHNYSQRCKLKWEPVLIINHNKIGITSRIIGVLFTTKEAACIVTSFSPFIVDLLIQHSENKTKSLLDAIIPRLGIWLLHNVLQYVWFRWLWMELDKWFLLTYSLSYPQSRDAIASKNCKTIWSPEKSVNIVLLSGKIISFAGPRPFLNGIRGSTPSETMNTAMHTSYYSIH